MNRFIVLLVFFLLFAGVPHVGANLEYYGIEGTVNEDLSVKNVITLKFKEPITHLDYQLNFEISNLTVKSDFPTADCFIKDSRIVSCQLAGVTPEENQLTLTFDVAGGAKQVDEKFQFSANYGFLPTDRAFIIVRLPQTAVLSENVVNASFSPEGGGILSDGKRIMVFWEMQDLEQQNIQFSVSYLLPQEIPSSLIIALTVVVIVVMVGVIVYARRRHHREDVISTVLTADEKVVIDILKKENGKALQKVLVKESDFSKAKVSRLVKDMKERGIVEIEPVSGRENRIIMSSGKKPEQEKEQPKEENTDKPAE